ncbi:MAG TPA: flagellin [Dongiaceae bacterium]|nr:flagellin [Dongiaceae bacterium]
MAQNINGLPNLAGLQYLSKTQNALDKALEKLASGKRINSAADDAAGLAIANRFQAQINGLNTASRNANDGISYAQVTESALEETTGNLQRIRDLSLQAANGSLNGNDRKAIQQEIDQLKSEIDRVAETTTFNGQKVLSGKSSASFQIGANSGESVSVRGFDASTKALGGQPGSVQSTSSRAQLGAGDSGTQGIQEGNAGATSISDLSVYTSGTPATERINIAAAAYGGTINNVQNTRDLTDTSNANYGSGTAKSVAERINSIRESGAEGMQDVYASARTTFNASDVTSADFSGNVNSARTTNVASGALANGDLNINGVDIGPVSFDKNDAGGDLVKAINQRSDVTGVTASVNDQGELELAAEDGRDIVVSTSSTAVTNRLFGGGQNRFDAAFNDLRVSGEVTISANDSIQLSGNDLAAAGLDNLQETNVQAVGTVSNINVSTSAGAQSAVDSVDAALSQIDNYRANIGAIQNRFESNIRNLSSVSESQSAALSRVQDTDYAAQIAELSREQVKRQAGIALQAQANALSRQVLALLS